MVNPDHFAPLFARKPRAQAMLYRAGLLGLGGHAPAFLSALSQRHRDRLREEVLAVYALYERYGADDLLAAMAERQEQGYIELQRREWQNDLDIPTRSHHSFSGVPYHHALGKMYDAARLGKEFCEELPEEKVV